MNSLKQQLLNDTFIRVTAIILVPDQYTRYIYICFVNRNFYAGNMVSFIQIILLLVNCE